LGLRAALADGRRAALITPDRTLSRQVAAYLDRWGIEPDDSAGRPLHQSTPGRLMLQTAAMLGRPVEAEALAIVLAHPLTRAGGDRTAHLRRARALEVDLLREGPCPFPDRAKLEHWAGRDRTPGLMDGWTEWLAALLDRLPATLDPAPLSVHLNTHMALLNDLTATPEGAESPLWQGEAGRRALDVVRSLAEAAPESGDTPISTTEFARILHAVLSAEEVRESFSPHPDVMIWGALEARVRTADLVILGGLNDGVWPDQPGSDPWLNRSMRAACGLRLPDRSVGLSAHDFQQAASGAEIWLSRAARDAEAETVPSRWLNRIEGLLRGLGGEAGAALDAMEARGARWLAMAAALDSPTAPHDPAPRPGPVVPVSAQPRRLSVTAIETLIRDPYAIYARHILGLRALGPLRQGPDARLRGTVVHAAMESFAREMPGEITPETVPHLRALLERTLEQEAPWPAMRRIWLGKFDRVTSDFLEKEAVRRGLGQPLFLEEEGRLDLPGLDFTLTAKADRMDDRGASVAIYDYKTGAAPSKDKQRFFAKQLLLEAVMVEEGAFARIGKRPVDEVAYLQIGSKYTESVVETNAEILDQIRSGLRDLIQRYRDGAPYMARLAPDMIEFTSDYEHLSRYGEWMDTDTARPIRVGGR
ncbi:MAG: double-strand break repair protein AddB, partial [Jannaschia sp.]